MEIKVKKGIALIVDILFAIIIFSATLFLLSSFRPSAKYNLPFFTAKSAEDILSVFEKKNVFANLSYSSLENELNLVLPKNTAANLTVTAYQYNATTNSFIQNYNVTVLKGNIGEEYSTKKRVVFRIVNLTYIIAELRLGSES